jgi:L-Lysine epsilon oxidase N-terminal/L-lysine epsilon oxidase C-terminal domain
MLDKNTNGDRYVIYPAIGVARVGNSDDFYIGPETYGGLPINPNGKEFTRNDFRDNPKEPGAERKIRRQAARFRIYRLRDGQPPEEVTLGQNGVVSITWTVHVANKKASWYEFQTKQGENGYPPNHPLRNPTKKTDEERRELFIDPGPRSISGANASGVHFSRDTIPGDYQGYFPPTNLEPKRIDTLGELRTDDQGRLLFLGGYGHAGSDSKDPDIEQYANNNGWWDDTSDGAVRAQIRIHHNPDFDLTVDAEPAWVICGPPSYAPQIPNVVTLYDTIFDASVRFMNANPEIYENGMWKGGKNGYKPYFETDIKPIFDRANGYAWVAAIPPRPHQFDESRLSMPDREYIGLRQYYLKFFRAPGNENVLVDPDRGMTLMPYLAGDDALRASAPGTVTAATSKYLRLTDTQYFFLMQWADGHFLPGARPDVPETDALTRAVLDNCVGGAFSPGIEMTWISRNPDIYSAPFRIHAKNVTTTGPLNLGFNPFAGMEPGDVTRYMAVPWQADFNECSSQPIVGRVLWWWPAQRPEFVYLEKKDLPPDVKPGLALDPQVPWVGAAFDQSADGYLTFIKDIEMVSKWDKLGFVFNIGTDKQPYFVEVDRTLPRQEPKDHE